MRICNFRWLVPGPKFYFVHSRVHPGMPRLRGNFQARIEQEHQSVPENTVTMTSPFNLPGKAIDRNSWRADQFLS
jgi:hypothetical protein